MTLIIDMKKLIYAGACLLVVGCKKPTPPEEVPMPSGRYDTVVTVPDKQSDAPLARLYVELDSAIRTGTPGTQNAAIRRLGELGDHRAVVILGSLLEDAEVSDQARGLSNSNPSGSGLVVYDTLAGLAVRALSKMNVADFPHRDYNFEVIIPKDDIAAWRAWWRENKAPFIEKARAEESAASAVP